MPHTVALALLESLRIIDTPAESGLEEEDLLELLPRRLGLSVAVEEQIHRYARLKGSRGRVRAQEVESLFSLIARRPDARRVFAEAGKQLAEKQLDHRSILSRLARSTFPRSARVYLAMRHVRRLAKRLNPDGEVRMERKSAGLIVRRCLPARAVSGSDGCALLGGAMEFLMGAYGVGEVAVTHPHCEGRQEESCIWRPERRPD